MQQTHSHGFCTFFGEGMRVKGEAERWGGGTVLLHVWLLEQKQSSAHRMQSERYRGQRTQAASTPFRSPTACFSASVVRKNNKIAYETISPLFCPFRKRVPWNSEFSSDAFVSHPCSVKTWIGMCCISLSLLFDWNPCGSFQTTLETDPAHISGPLIYRETNMFAAAGVCAKNKKMNKKINLNPRIWIPPLWRDTLIPITDLTTLVFLSRCPHSSQIWRWNWSEVSSSPGSPGMAAWMSAQTNPVKYSLMQSCRRKCHMSARLAAAYIMSCIISYRLP